MRQNCILQYISFSFHKKKDHRRTFLEETLLFCRDTVNFVFIFRESIKKPLLLLSCGLQCAKTRERCRLQSSTLSPRITRFPLTWIFASVRVSYENPCQLSHKYSPTHANFAKRGFSRNQNTRKSGNRCTIYVLILGHPPFENVAK